MSQERWEWCLGMKAQIGVDADSGLVDMVTTTAANEADVEQVMGVSLPGNAHVSTNNQEKGHSLRIPLKMTDDSGRR